MRQDLIPHSKLAPTQGLSIQSDLFEGIPADYKSNYYGISREFACFIVIQVETAIVTPNSPPITLSAKINLSEGDIVRIDPQAILTHVRQRKTTDSISDHFALIPERHVNAPDVGSEGQPQTQVLERVALSFINKDRPQNPTHSYFPQPTHKDLRVPHDFDRCLEQGISPRLVDTTGHQDLQSLTGIMEAIIYPGEIAREARDSMHQEISKLIEEERAKTQKPAYADMHPNPNKPNQAK